MACKGLIIGGAKVMICGLPKPKACYYCGRVSIALCDYPVGKYRNGRRKDCDRPLCDAHREKGMTPGVDFCREHFPAAKAAYERRQLKAAA